MLVPRFVQYLKAWEICSGLMTVSEGRWSCFGYVRMLEAFVACGDSYDMETSLCNFASKEES